MQSLINKTSELLKTPDQWDNYCELVELKDQIINMWRQSVHNSIMEYFNHPDNQIEGWKFDFTKHGLMPHFRWIPTNCDTIFTINLYQFKDFNLWLHANEIDSDAVKKKIKSDQFKRLLSNHRNDDDSHAWFIFQEKGNFYFEGATCNGNFDYRRMLWYAYHRFDDYIKQLTEKLNLIRTEENVLLFQELYQEVKK